MPDQISELTEVSLRSQWPDEEADFTPWLAENIDRLGDILDIDLEVQETEANIGGYYADIHATDITGEQTVIIENQYEESDHTHLGQSMVYAGGIDADIVIWVAEEFTDPYLDALQWFNTRTDDETGFFAVEASLVQIEGPPVAPQFSIVERPSSWNIVSGDLTETEREHRRFWFAFEDRLDERGFSEWKQRRPRASASRVTERYGDAYVRLAATARNRVYCMVRIEDESGDFGGLNQEEVTEVLRETHEGLETSIKDHEVEDINWESNPGSLYDKIVLEYADPVDRSDESEWETYHDWLIDAARLFDEVLRTRL